MNKDEMSKEKLKLLKTFAIIILLFGIYLLLSVVYNDGDLLGLGGKKMRNMKYVAYIAETGHLEAEISMRWKMRYCSEAIASILFIVSSCLLLYITINALLVYERHNITVLPLSEYKKLVRCIIKRQTWYPAQTEKKTTNKTECYIIIECPACHQKIRLPQKNKKLFVTCKRCKYEFYQNT